MYVLPRVYVLPPTAHDLMSRMLDGVKAGYNCTVSIDQNQARGYTRTRSGTTFSRPTAGGVVKLVVRGGDTPAAMAVAV